MFSRLLCARYPKEIECLSLESDEYYDEFKFKVAETIRASLDCLEKLSKVKDALSIDLNKEFSLDELKKALDELIALKPRDETDTELVIEPVQEMSEIVTEETMKVKLNNH